MKTAVKQAVILAGGLGTRLHPLTLSTPKPMVNIKGKPFLEYLIELLVQNGLKEIVILIGYKGDQIRNYFKDGKRFGVKITYFDSGVEAGTGLRLKEAHELLDDNFLLLYGDNYWPLKLTELVRYLAVRKAEALITVYTNRDGYTKNNIFVNKKGIVVRYEKKPKKGTKLNAVDVGFFILQKKHIDLLPSTDSSFEEIVLPALIKTKKFAGFVTDHRYYGLSNITRIKNIEDYFTPKKPIFIDRDGVINKKSPQADYIKSWREFILLPNVIKSLRLLTEKNYQIYIITNQAGIARGIMSLKDVNEIHANMLALFKAKKINIKGIYVCPHGWDEGCFCRKPNPGMFFQAASEHAFNLYESYCIGDDPRDILAANRAGCKNAYLISVDNSFYDIVQTLL